MIEALESLGDFAAELEWADVPETIQDRTLLVLFDTIGVTLAGARTPEVRSLVEHWPMAPGSVPAIGLGIHASPEPAIWINAMSLCCLELDEGSKYARGHPAGHVLPASVAVAFEADVSGPGWLEAFLAGYEVGARFGRASRLRSDVHPHGNWGTAGAAAATSRAMGLKAHQIAASLDAAAGLVLCSPFECAFSGNLIRNAWMGAAGNAGLIAARMAKAGLARSEDTAAHSLGKTLGSFDPAELTGELGARWEIAGGYFKRYAACAYTHAAADAVRSLQETDPADIVRVDVDTYHIAAGLNRIQWPSRLAAMFSIPYVVAVMLLEGDFGPEATSDACRGDPRVRSLAEKVHVRSTQEFENRLPQRRGARVTVHLVDGTTRTSEVENPIGDADNQPLGWADVRAKIELLVGPEATAKLEGTIRAVPSADRVQGLLSLLAEEVI